MKLRIAMISEHASPIAPPGGVNTGGQNVYVAQVAAHLVDLGHEVDVFTRRDGVSHPETLATPAGYGVCHVPAGPPCTIPKEELLPHMESFGEYMIDRLSRRRCDLIHANFFMSGMVAMRLKRRLGVPFVMTFHALGRVRLLHQGATDRFPIERLAIEDQLMSEADRIIAECPQDAEDQIQLYAADADKLRIVPCGFDESELEPVDRGVARAELGIERNLFTVLQLGRMVPRKGIDDAIRGFARMVREHGVDGQMLVVGGETDIADPIKTPEIGRLQAIASAEGVSDRVIFAGRVDRKRLKHFYSAADVFVTTPWYEPFGITPLEAMACGTPVVGADVGGIKYSVSHGQTGFLVPPRDPAALARRLAELARNEPLRARLGRQSLWRVRRLFTWRKVTEAIERIYREIAARPAPLRLNSRVGAVAEIKSTP